MKSIYPRHRETANELVDAHMPSHIRDKWKNGRWKNGGLKKVASELMISRSALEKDAIALNVDFMHYVWYLEEVGLMYLYKKEVVDEPIAYFNRHYPNIVVLAKDLNVSLTELRMNVLQFRSLEKAVLHTENKFNTSKKIPVVYRGTPYNSLLEVCRALEVDYYQVKMLRHRGYSPEEAIDVLVGV